MESSVARARSPRCHRLQLTLALGILLLLALAAPAYGEKTVFTSNAGSLGGIESVTPFTMSSDGSLVPHPVVAVGDRPEGVAVTPDARFLYAATDVSPGVRGYAIGPNGGLTEVSGSPFETKGINTTGIAITPDGKRLLVTNRGTGLNNAVDPGSVAVYDIHQATGALTLVSGSPFAITGLEDPTGVAVAPDGGRAFVAGDAAGTTFDGRVAVFDLDQTTGGLSPVTGSPFATGAKQSFSLLLAPDGGRLFVGNLFGSSSISELEINQVTGALTPIAGSPFATAGTAPRQLALAPDGQRLFSAERAPEGGGNTGLSVYDIAENGLLTTVEGSPFSTGANEAIGTATAPDGRTAYAMTSSNPGAVAGFSIGASGALTKLAGSPYPTGDQFAEFFPIAMTPSQTPQPAFDPTTSEFEHVTSFDASATTVPGGRATRFDWDFGDGAKLANGGPSPTHSYRSLGSFTVTLTVTNDCAADAVFTGNTVFTGQTAHCRGSRTATVSKTLAVVDTTAPVVSGLKIAKRFTPSSKPTARSATVSVKRGAKIRYSLSEQARVKFVIERQRAGTAKAKKRRRFRTVAVLTRPGKQGGNVVPFSGRIGHHRLARGRYRLVVTATDSSGNSSKPKRKTFSIVRAGR